MCGALFGLCDRSWAQSLVAHASGSFRSTTHEQRELGAEWGLDGLDLDIAPLARFPRVKASCPRWKQTVQRVGTTWSTTSHVVAVGRCHTPSSTCRGTASADWRAVETPTWEEGSGIGIVA